MIPKIIHYCWLSGDPYPENIQRCIDSWKRVLPDYEIILWDTNRFNLSSSDWVMQAFEAKKYAFAADYIRMYALYNYGGIYLDSDVEVFKSFDDFLENDFFFGYEYTGIPEAAVIGADKGLPWIKQCLDWYLKNDYLDKKGWEKKVIAPLILKYGFEATLKVKLIDKGIIQKVCGGCVYPYDYFSARDWYTGNKLISKNTYSIHYFKGSWYTKDIKIKTKNTIHSFLIKVMGKNRYNKAMYRIRNLIHNP